MDGGMRSQFCLTKCQNMLEIFSWWNYTSAVGLLPTISKSHYVKKKAAVSVSSIKRSRVKVTATVHGSNQNTFLH